MFSHKKCCKSKAQLQLRSRTRYIFMFHFFLLASPCRQSRYVVFHHSYHLPNSASGRNQEPNYPEYYEPFICSGGEMYDPPVMGQYVACWQLSGQMCRQHVFIHPLCGALFFLIKTCRLMQIIPPGLLWGDATRRDCIWRGNCCYKTGTGLKPDATSNWMVCAGYLTPPAFKR